MGKKVREGYKKTDFGEIPIEWKVKKFRDIFERIVEKNKNNISDNVLTISAQNGLINQEKFFNKSVASKNTSNYFLLKKGDFAYNKSYSSGYPMGAIKRLNSYNKGIVSPLYICFRIKDENINSDFYEQFFEYDLFDKAISGIAQEGARNHGLLNVAVNEFFDLPIIVPTKEEQKKIAEILSTVDKQIENTEKLIQKNQELKKGLMQQLLTKGIGHTEFKKTKLGNIPKEWKIKKIYDLVQYMKSGLSRNLKDDDIGIPCIRSNNIIDNKIDDKDLKYWYLEDDKGANINEYILDDGDILVNFINSVAQIGKTCIYKDIGRPVIYTTNIFRIKMNQDVILNKYFYYFTQIEKYKKEIMLITKQAVNQASFTTQDFKRIELMVPPIEEQDKIVLILSSIDEKIEEYKNKKESLKEVKKGLMEQLLTGKLRID
ncbi:restriction endonuclease subunit S [Clostridium perfringens]|uniref:restriction endonuclease subunit S n=1 Tax=Clostridium perfringens TaxID=1502 RepID=UPI000D898AD3|nr:restriction endonuclease subunit S [Clostridium perfringens]MDK0591935.1 restriction endonuclease subunit S [Clostridium perfringens]MDK0594878.1 restriction endonuclease subunit S [Clostridium perfringens]MDK0738543.1 restriction endonuclease subunit S [Clostridium perfringens]MDM0624182.1 restriction endonuclease subunit S [Clostridium perfringens]MDM0810191.1 restriction endonuclease subunit S [Clostridium perfringens]